ncbi:MULTISPECIES: hypothetical protein [unclassified Streptomyces]|uniref:hypothetical protein n=1 Tax=unclassified Streptomyces TaxID=2593676 RepID=UPI0028C47416|nr:MULTISPECIES: hypothetical protein [unclassified Streptomyces]WNO74423.1 hypothetical protein RPQ07_23670 [Streptomyces sp. AM8-1-1]
MRRGLVHAMAWSLSTGAAVTLSWWGVHTVMSGTAYDRPRALPISADTATTQGSKPQASSTQEPPAPPSSPSPSKERKRSPSTTPSTGKSDKSEAPSSASPPQQSAPAGSVKGYTVDGGRVVFDIRDTYAELASATPDAGWQMQVWKQPEWIRVTFTKDGRESSVFCTWNGHPPMVQFDKR